MSAPEDSSVAQTNQPKLCVKCNSFFSNAACNDLCSQCHREEETSKAKSLAAAEKMEALVRRPADAQSTNTTEDASTSTPAPTSATPLSTVCGDVSDKNKPSRCNMCRKKVGLCGFKCKCGQTFCGQHRYAESHACKFDYKSLERAKLTEANPVVQAMKVQKL